VIPALPIGTYTLTVSKDGFSALKFPEIVLQAGRENLKKLLTRSASLAMAGNNRQISS
jgi:hypothetical protein